MNHARSTLILTLLAAAGCFPVDPGEPDDTATDTTDSGGPFTCDGWTPTTTTTDTTRPIPTTSTTGATTTTPITPSCTGDAGDLVTTVTVTAPDGTACGACEATEIDVVVQVHNPCPVDIEVDDGCRAFGGLLTNVTTDESVEFIAECYPTTATSSTMTVPAGGSAVWYEDGWSNLDPGVYTLAYDLAAVPDVDTAFCLSAP